MQLIYVRYDMYDMSFGNILKKYDESVKKIFKIHKFTAKSAIFL